MQNMKDTSQPKSSSNLSDIDTMKYEDSAKHERNSAKDSNGTTSMWLPYHLSTNDLESFPYLVHCTKNAISQKLLIADKSIGCSSGAAKGNSFISLTNLRLEQGNFVEADNHDKYLRAEINEDNPIVETKTHGYNNEVAASPRGAIDLISTIENTPKDADESCLAGDGRDKFELSPQLELSLRNFSTSSCKQEPDERQTLNHSDASAFSL